MNISQVKNGLILTFVALTGHSAIKINALEEVIAKQQKTLNDINPKMVRLQEKEKRLDRFEKQVGTYIDRPITLGQRYCNPEMNQLFTPKPRAFFVKQNTVMDPGTGQQWLSETGTLQVQSPNGTSQHTFNVTSSIEKPGMHPYLVQAQVQESPNALPPLCEAKPQGLAGLSRDTTIIDEIPLSTDQDTQKVQANIRALRDTHLSTTVENMYQAKTLLNSMPQALDPQRTILPTPTPTASSAIPAKTEASGPGFSFQWKGRIGF
jgi:hypothetical protein